MGIEEYGKVVSWYCRVVGVFSPSIQCTYCMFFLCQALGSAGDTGMKMQFKIVPWWLLCSSQGPIHTVFFLMALIFSWTARKQANDPGDFRQCCSEGDRVGWCETVV